MNSFENFKETGFEWIGKIPINWKLSRIGRFFIERNEKVDDVTYPPLSVTMSGIVDQLSDVAKTNDGDNRKLVKKNDFVINSRSDRKGSSGIAPRDGSVSLINIVLEPQELNPDYIQYLFKSYYFKEEFFRNGKGIHWDLWTTRWDQLKNINIPTPTVKEQKLISRYLDKKTEQIDRFVEKIQKKIKLLKEKRLKLIEDIILNPETKRIQLKHLVNLVSRPVERIADKNYTKIGMYNWGRGVFKYPSEKGSDLGDSSFNFLKEGDLLLSGQFSWEGSVSIIEKKFHDCISSHRFYILNTKRNNLLHEYLWTYFTSQEGHFILNENSPGSAGRNRPLNINNLLREKIPLPKIEFQLEIQKLVKESQIFENHAKKKIELLKEYRQSLISSVLTGKLRVKEDMI